MKCNWKECTLGDLITFQRGHDLPKSQMTDGKYPVVGSNGIIGYHNEYTTEAPSITIGRSGNVGNPFIVYGQTWSHNTTLYVKDFKGNDPVFVYYFLKTMDLANYAGGSAVPTLNRNHIHTLPIKVPESVGVQKKIGYYLRLLDEKIELNNAINNNLLEQALTLYSTQFATFDRNGCIGDYCSIKSGFAFKSSWWTHNGIKVIKIGSINQDNLNLLECSYVDKDKIDKAKDFKVGAGDLLIAMTGATIGKFAMVPYSSEILLVNQRVGKFFLGDNPVKKLPFIYCTLKQPEVYCEIVNRGQGSAQPNISASDIMCIPCVIPSKETIIEFNDIVQPLFDLIISNQQENQQLSELRDSLLPKLMSDEIDVSCIDI